MRFHGGVRDGTRDSTKNFVPTHFGPAKGDGPPVSILGTHGDAGVVDRKGFLVEGHDGVQGRCLELDLSE